jgi:hypothetical protein
MSLKRKTKPYKIRVRLIDSSEEVIVCKVKKRGLINLFIKMVSFALIIALNWSGLSAVYQTIAYYNDIEQSPVNNYTASTLDFSLNSPPDFLPVIMPNATSSRDISLTNNGILGFQYTASTSNATGTLCNYLNLEAKLNGTTTYNGALTDFNYNVGGFATTTRDWQFTATLTSDDPSLQNQTCVFDFIFDGTQIGGTGFYDQEIIQNTITSGIWQKVVINKVYYDVDVAHGTEPQNEWIELYNPNDQAVNVKDWGICDNNDCVTINPNVSIPALGYALLSHDASTWQYWEILDGVIKIHALGGGFIAMNNDADMLVFKNASSTIIDQMNWGTPTMSTTTWPNYNSGVWNPGVPDAPQGHMLARVPSGFDTDQPSDWHDLGLPQVTVNWPNGGEVLYVGQTYTLQWTATNPNGDQDNTKLNIDIYYSGNSGATWAAIATSTQNDGSFEWRAPLFIEPGHYYVPSSHARIKVVATGPENFMVQAWDMSDADFCPPIDYSLLTDEEKTQVEQLLADGILTEADIINREAITMEETEEGSGGVENPIITDDGTTTEDVATTTEEVATTTEEISTTTENNQEGEGIIEQISEAINSIIDEIVEEILPDELTNEETPTEDAQIIDETATIEEIPTVEELVIEEVSVIEEQPVIAPEADSAEPPAGE